MPSYFDTYQSFIKDIYIEIPNYRFNHRPSTGEKDDDNFIGREKIKKNFLDILLNGKNNGVYLVTGYRGMGKTSFVNKVVEEFKEELKKNKQAPRTVKEIKISLGQSKLEEIDILRHIVKTLLDDLENNKTLNSFIKLFFWVKLICVGYILSRTMSIFGYLTNIANLDLSQFRTEIVTSIASGVFVLINIIESFSGKTKLKNRLLELYERCYATITKDEQTGGGIKDIINFLRRKTHVYPIANAKEIEYEIIDILKKITDKNIVFIFDELDKVEPDFDKGVFQIETNSDNIRTYLNDLRDRRNLIIKTLSSLKHLFTEGNARFIFIAGREMFDAALADISDRQSSLSSVFHHIIYVESFLRENPNTSYPHKQGMTHLIEQFLDKVLIPEKCKPRENIKNKTPIIKAYNKNEPFLKNYYSYLENCVYYKSLEKIEEEIEKLESSDISDKDQKKITYNLQREHIYIQMRKVIFTLQNFIIYLTYRSSGSPKKLVMIFEETFVNESIFSKDEESEKKKFIKIYHRSHKKENRIFLNFSFKHQYKLGFNAYLIHPYLLMYNHTLSNSSDSVLVSTPFLMDNLIKFHPFAFSIYNLELFPEILSTNKTPELRAFVEDLVAFLGQNHIRETDSGIFQYKFFDRTHNEIAFISKIFDEESAAFNFSLDESYSIKSHISAKIKFLRTTFKDYLQKDKPVVNSIVFLNDVLGDSQLFDEFYEDAIIAYNDALQGIPIPESGTSVETFLIWMRIKLKIALVYEKMKYYEMSMGILGAAMQTAYDYFASDQANQTSIDQSRSIFGGSKINKISNPIFRELLQVTQQAILGSIYVQEKFTEGLTFGKLNSYLENYERLHKLRFYNEYSGRDTLMGSFYGNIGTIMYYKNKSLPLRIVQRIADSDGDFDKIQTHILTIPIMKRTPFSEPYVTVSLKEIIHFDPNFSKIAVTVDESSSSIVKRRDVRFSFATYVTYKSSLATILALDEIYSLEGIINECVNILMDYKNVHTSRKLTGIANNITKIADLLLSLVGAKVDIEKSPKGFLEKMRKNYSTKKNEENLESGSNLLRLLDKSIFEIDQETFDTQKVIRYRMVENWDNEKINLDYILILYYLSGRIYLKAGRGVTCGFQFRKMLLTIHTVKPTTKIEDVDEMKLLCEFLKETILKKILEIASWNSNSSDRPQISGYKYYFNISDTAVPPNLTNEFYQNLSNNPDTKEALILFANLKLRTYVGLSELSAIETTIKELSLLTPYNSISHQITRVMELALQVRINRLILGTIINKKLFVIYNKNNNIGIALISDRYNNKITKSWESDLFIAGFDINSSIPFSNDEFSYYDNKELRKEATTTNDTRRQSLNALLKEILLLESSENKDGIELFEHYTALIINSIFSLHQIIVALNLYGINYMQNYSYLASFHDKMGDWLKHQNLCKVLRAELAKHIVKINGKEEVKYPKLSKILDDMDNTLNDLFGTGGLKNLEDPLTHYQLALQYYQKALQMHSEGQTYKLVTNNLIYLEDDYNDNLYHFGAAIERQQINSGRIRKKIQKLEKELKNARLYKYEYYLK